MLVRTIYPSPRIPSSLTWVPHSRLASVLWPFGHHNPTVCSLACRWRLRSALRAEQESFSIETHPISLIVGPHADSSEMS